MQNFSKKTYVFLGIVALALFGWYLFERNIGTINVPSTVDVKEGEEGSVSSLEGFKVPEGFSLNIFAKDVKGARVIELDPKARIIVSETSEGKIVALSDTDNDNVSDETKVIASGLKKPHGMAFKCEDTDKCFLYVAESDALYRYLYDADTPSLSKKEKLIDIDSSISDRHYTRSLLFLPSPDEDTLLISVGSSCDVCNEEDEDHASIISYNIKTGKKESYAEGLRNATFLTLNPVSGKVFAAEMGRDNLGDNLPPDEINIIEKGKNYGWPLCYGKNIQDTKFDSKQYFVNPCANMAPSFVDLQAHSAPLGLSFIPEEGWPEEYWYNLLVSYHGSWNRSEPTGYKIARIKMNSKGEYLGMEDFITGWLTKEGEKTGRPVDIKVLSGGVAYISDDSSGVIYRLHRNR